MIKLEGDWEPNHQLTGYSEESELCPEALENNWRENNGECLSYKCRCGWSMKDGL